jgi:hypothetical protein
MTAEQARLLPLGLYVLRWTEGGTSLAAVGQLYDGARWYAPVNWTSRVPGGIACTNWSLVELAVHLTRPEAEAAP